MPASQIPHEGEAQTKLLNQRDAPLHSMAKATRVRTVSLAKKYVFPHVPRNLSVPLSSFLNESDRY
jgi:hypothetical protein